MVEPKDEDKKEEDTKDETEALDTDM